VVQHFWESSRRSKRWALTNVRNRSKAR